MLLALIKGNYRFLWGDVGSSASLSDAQIFNHSKLKKKIEDGTLGLEPPEPLGQGGPELQDYLMGDDTFALMPWLVKPNSRRQLAREERIAKYRISRDRRVVKNALEIMSIRLRVLLGTMVQRSKIVRQFLTCVVLHNILRTHQWGLQRVPNPADGTAVMVNETPVYVPDENDRNPLREAKHQQDLPKDCFTLVYRLGRRTGYVM